VQEGDENFGDMRDGGRIVGLDVLFKGNLLGFCGKGRVGDDLIRGHGKIGDVLWRRQVRNERTNRYIRELTQ
jgi:hypothetical protein